MLEFLGSGLMGSILGGFFRLAPELLKFLDRKDEREHELSMFKEQIELEKTKGEFKVEEKYVDYSINQMQAIGEAFKEQSAAASASYKWVAALSALVRPIITYVLFFAYIAYKSILIYYATTTGVDWHTIAINHWGNEDFAMLNMILTFWFIGRAVEKYRKT